MRKNADSQRSPYCRNNALLCTGYRLKLTAALPKYLGPRSLAGALIWNDRSTDFLILVFCSCASGSLVHLPSFAAGREAAMSSMIMLIYAGLTARR